MSRDDFTRIRTLALLDEQAALRRVATLVAHNASAATLFEQVCRELGVVLGVRSTDMIRFEDGAATLVAAWSSSGGPAFEIGERIPIDGDTVTAKIHRSGSPQRVDDYTGVSGPLAERLLAIGVRSVVGAPIKVAGRLWGATMASSDEAHGFPPRTEQRIADFGELVTAALANADAREQLAASRARIVTAADDARRRIERDLHDGAQQQLVSLALSLRILEPKLEPGSEAARELVAARAELDQALGELRELARGIHPSVLSDRGLEAALRGLAGRSPVPVDLDVEGCETLPPALQTTAYFVAAEGLTNAFKHARCSQAAVRVGVEEGWATIEVSDDGVGGTRLDGGSGLRGLVDRVSALGGGLEIDSPPGAGTMLRARIEISECVGLAAAKEEPGVVAAG